MLSYSQTRTDFVSQKVHDHDDPDDEEEVSNGWADDVHFDPNELAIRTCPQPHPLFNIQVDLGTVTPHPRSVAENGHYVAVVDLSPMWFLVFSRPQCRPLH